MEQVKVEWISVRTLQPRTPAEKQNAIDWARLYIAKGFHVKKAKKSLRKLLVKEYAQNENLG